MKFFPPLKSVAPVFSLIVFLTYGWSVVVTLWKLPSWLLYMTLGDLAAAFSYIFIVNLLESVAFMLGLLVLSALLPGSFLRQAFTARGAALTLIIAASAMLHLSLHANADLRDEFISSLPLWWGCTLLLAAGVTWLSARWNWLEKALSALADRTLVFLYLTLPLTAIAVLIVLIRNILW